MYSNIFDDQLEYFDINGDEMRLLLNTFNCLAMNKDCAMDGSYLSLEVLAEAENIRRAIEEFDHLKRANPEDGRLLAQHRQTADQLERLSQKLLAMPSWKAMTLAGYIFGVQRGCEFMSEQTEAA